MTSFSERRRARVVRRQRQRKHRLPHRIHTIGYIGCFGGYEWGEIPFGGAFRSNTEATGGARRRQSDSVRRRFLKEAARHARVKGKRISQTVRREHAKHAPLRGPILMSGLVGVIFGIFFAAKDANAWLEQRASTEIASLRAREQAHLTLANEYVGNRLFEAHKVARRHNIVVEQFCLRTSVQAHVCSEYREGTGQYVTRMVVPGSFRISNDKRFSGN